MKRLRVFNHLDEILGRQTRGRDRLKRMEIVRGPTFPEEADVARFERKVWVDYRIRIGARHCVPDTEEGIQRGREKVCRSLGREIFGDLREELIDLLEWSSEEGIGQDLEDKIERLIKLTEGQEVG